jgi:hypothetical protein
MRLAPPKSYMNVTLKPARKSLLNVTAQVIRLKANKKYLICW